MARTPKPNPEKIPANLHGSVREYMELRQLVELMADIIVAPEDAIDRVTETYERALALEYWLRKIASRTDPGYLTDAVQRFTTIKEEGRLL